jgi:integrase
MGKRLRHQLNALTVDKAKPKATAYRLADGGGLYLWVPPSGVKVWQFRYRHDGKPQTATLGRYSRDVQSLTWARQRADEARSRAEAGDHLTRVKAVAKATKRTASANTFGKVAADWIKTEARRARWTDDYREEVTASLRNHLEKLDPLPVTEITAAIASPHLRRVEKSAPDMAKKVRQRLRGILDHAVEEGLITANPIPPPRRRKGGSGRKNLPALTTREAVGDVLRRADKVEASRGVKRAHLLAAFTGQRIGEIVPAEWTEVDWQSGVWSIPRDRMKRKDADRGPHLVPLPPRLLTSMREWRRLDGDQAQWICVGPNGNAPITREAVEKFYRRTLQLAGRHSPHSWRTVLSTWANDAGEDSDAVEAQLDHGIGTKVKAAYDRAKRLQRRADLMAWHEAALLAARDGAEVVPLTRALRT